MGKGVFRKIIKGGGMDRPSAVRTSGMPSPEAGSAAIAEKKARQRAPEAATGDFPEEQGLGHEPGSERGDRGPASPATDAADHQDLERVSEVYGDVEVCRYLRIRRRKLAEARTKATRGIDWDCVGLHAGMTMKWIHQEALRLGIVPDFHGAPLTPIKEGDGVVSCKLIGTWPNRTRVTVEVVATGEIKVATVRDANEFHLNEIFDARDYGREIAWAAELNNATY